MPFDALTPTAPEIDLSKPSLAALEHVLRHHELWPADFQWNYLEWDTCAGGLSCALWGGYNDRAWGEIAKRAWGEIAKRFGVNLTNAKAIFLSANPPGVSERNTTPEHVADAIARVRAANQG